jgi:hypothetical protein
MQIHVARPPAQLGVFSQEEVAAGLQDGRFLPSDQGWKEGMAAWLPLSQWNEFAGLGVPSSPAASAEAVTKVFTPSGASQLPWEQERSLGSAWRSLVALVSEPAEVLGNARLDFGSTLLLVWFAAAIGAIFTVIGGVVYAEQLAAVMVKSGSDILRSANQVPGPMGELLRTVGNYLEKTEPKSFFAVLLQTLGFVAIAPFLNFFYGFLQWLALRLLGLFGVKSCKGLPLGRTAVAGMLGIGLGGILLSAVTLFPPGIFQQLLMYVLFIPFTVVYARIIGGALKLNPWLVVGSALLGYILFVCCCGCGLGVMLGALGMAG